MWIADTAHARLMDQRSTEQFGLSGIVLMERAGLAVFDELRRMMPQGGRMAVVCGKGSNGGDGFVIARLGRQQGWDVVCLCTALEAELEGDARRMMQLARAQGVDPIFADDARMARRLAGLGQMDIIVDAILGTGARGQIHGAAHSAISAVNRSGVPIVSVDVPSGILADTGEELGESIWALKTITMGQPKPFLFQGIGLEHSGHWQVADIGYPRDLMHEETGARLIDAEWAARVLPERLRNSHKGANGHILIVAGSRRMRGAAVLAVKAALRSGVGMVTVAGIEPVLDAVMAHCPEAVLMPLPECGGGISPDAADALLESQGRFQAALFGPGMTHLPCIQDLFSKVWPRWETPSVIDADALNAASQGVPLPHAPCVLTPHPGEMSRLMQTTISEVQANRFASVRAAAAALRGTVLLKGPYSIVGEGEKPLLVNPTGNPGMATAGMGDVLSGVIAALLSQDVEPLSAAAAGMYWHGAAGDLCAARLGAVGYTASDVADTIPQARAKILEWSQGSA
jgi:NAD(P)H-hydrate epimerase